MGEETVPRTGSGPGSGPGLRERKKRETRRRIADIATGLFLMRGFDNVTIADVARTADVSVNTVFNYFKTKEDLFFDREDEMVEAAARDVRDRRPGESVVALFRRRFFEGLDAGEYRTAFHEGADTWLQAVHDSPALTARMRELGQRIQDELAALLAEETGAGPDDFTPRAAAAMIHAAQGALVTEISARKRAGQTLEEMRADVYAAAARTFDLLEHGLGGYAAAPPAAAAAPPGDGPPDGAGPGPGTGK